MSEINRISNEELSKIVKEEVDKAIQSKGGVSGEGELSKKLDEISKLNNEIVELKGKARSFDLSNTTSYSSVDLLKRLSRLEEEVYGNNK